MAPKVPESDSKAVWRRWAKRKRSETVCDSLALTQVLYRFVEDNVSSKSVILSYWPIGDEYDLRNVVGVENDRRMALTRTDSETGRLSVRNTDEGLEKHPYGFMQPIAESSEVDLSLIGAVFVPGLAFDISGCRLGWGKGYYDRLLPEIQNANPDVFFLGIAGHQLVTSVPVESHDVPMTHLVTETSIRAAVKSI